MKIAVSGQVLCAKYELDKALCFIKQQGVEGIEIWPTCIKKGANNYREFSKEQISAAAKVLEENEILVACVTCAGAFDKTLSENPAQYAEELCAAVEVARQLRAKYVNHYCYHLSLHEYDEQKLLASMMPALKLAEKYGIILVLEMKRMIRQVRRKVCRK